MKMDAKFWTALLHWVLIAGAQSYNRGNTYSVQELSQEASPSGDAEPWAEDASFLYHGGGVPGSEYGDHFLMQYSRAGDVYHGMMPTIHAYRPSIRGRDYNRYPHILPPGGKSVEQLQEEADVQLQRMFSRSREHERSVGEKVKKLKEAYGYGTIGYPGYKNNIKYGPIDLGTHNAIDLGATIAEHGGLRLPVQTVTVTKTLGVRVPEPYPVPQEVPVPAPFPVPVPSDAHVIPDIKQYLDAFASDFSGRGNFAKPQVVVVEKARASKGGAHAGLRSSDGFYAGKVPPRTALGARQHQ